MAKLFALEQESKEDDPLDKRNQLLIDKVLQYEEKTKSDVSVTADLIKQRHDLRDQITKEFKEYKKENEEGDEDTGGADNESSDEGDQDTGSEGSGSSEKESKSDGDQSEDKDSGDPKDSDVKDKDEGKGGDSEESEESAAADDVDSLRSLVGSGGKKKEASESFHTKPAQKTPAVKPSVDKDLGTVGFVTALKQIFEPLKAAHRRRVMAIESFGIKDKPKITDQPLVYVKDEVIESLTRLVTLANQYIQKNDSTITQVSDGVKKLGEQLTVYREYVSAEKFHFSQALIQQEDLMKALSVKGKNELPYTATLLAKYLQDSSAISVKILQNPFDQIPDAFVAGGYTKDEQGVFVNPTMLPGFVTMQASVVPYSNYIETQYEEYQVYKLQTYKPQDLYSLPALSLDNDSDIRKFLNELDKITIAAGMNLDNLKVINTQYKKFIDSIKSIIFDVENDTQKDLAGLGLDDKLKDFIKFKLVTELHINDIDAAVAYMSASLSALAHLVELSDK